MQIFGNPYSPPTRLVVNVARYLDLEFQYELIDLFKGEQHKPEYLEKNPKKKVPLIIESDGFQLSESYSIVRYLAEKNNRVDIYPTDPKQRAAIDMHLSLMNDLRINGQIYLTAKIVLPKIGKENIFPEIVTTNSKVNLDKIMKEYDTLLEGRNYVVGDSLTLADFNLFVLQYPLQYLLKEQLQVTHPNIYRFAQHLKEVYPVFAQDEKEFLEFLSNF
ncbi:glutathione s-transferase [Stylonychia lemnae]|uniref:Glutathione s-transferase n=1 Tax=Stylonychia lemnae TaxID=5949 RepID=A0A078A6U5_STYLE|nr:glutathione s-transferase [Stylonychia lemnae]|eukprot:CDW77954.1 glutathione s-transferase [Stylonychia lemnae]